MKHPRLTRQQAYAFTSRVYRFVREQDSDLAILLMKIPKEFVKPRHKRRKRALTYTGLWEYDDVKDREVIKLDYRHELLPSFLHEIVHAFHPEWTEQRVLREERRLVRSLSRRQMINLLRCLANVV